MTFVVLRLVSVKMGEIKANVEYYRISEENLVVVRVHVMYFIYVLVCRQRSMVNAFVQLFGIVHIGTAPGHGKGGRVLGEIKLDSSR